LAAQGAGTCGCGRAGQSRAVAGGTGGRSVILPRIRGAHRQGRRRLLPPDRHAPRIGTSDRRDSPARGCFGIEKDLT
jgi:hypothetical protein